jgi:hypothetical protein
VTETPWWELADDSIEFRAPSTPPLTRDELDLIEGSDGSSSEPQSDSSTAAPVRAHTWEPIDIVKLDDSPPEPPAISGLFYVGKRHVVSGEAEAGKSWLLLAAAAEEINAGHGVVWIDTDDMGASATLERLRSLGVADELIRQRFAFMQPNEPLSHDAASSVTGWLAAHNGRLVVFDAFNATLTLHGLDPNSTVDVETFYQRVVNPFCRAGAAAAIPDHVVKKSEERGKYSYGSERKHSGTEVHLGLKAISAFGRGRTGKAKVTVHKDRPGFLTRPSPGLFVLASDPESGVSSWTIEPDEDVSRDGVFRPTTLMAKVSDYLYAANEPRSRNQIEHDVRGKRDYVRSAIDMLLAEEYASEVTGDRGARLVKLDRAFREDAE